MSDFDEHELNDCLFMTTSAAKIISASLARLSPVRAALDVCFGAEDVVEMEDSSEMTVGTYQMKLRIRHSQEISLCVFSQ